MQVEAIQELSYGGFWRRLGAFWLDAIVLTPVMLIPYFGQNSFRLFDLYWFFPGLLLGLWYDVYLVIRYGGTPGKRMLKLRIAMVDGSAITPKAAKLRYLVMFVLTVIFSVGACMSVLNISDDTYFALSYVNKALEIEKMAPAWYEWASNAMLIWICAEFLTMLFNKKRRAVHDFIAGTVVLYEPTNSIQKSAEL